MRERIDVEAGYAEKEKVKTFYRVTEHELRRYVKEAIISSEDDVTHLLRALELRLDSVVYRLGYTGGVGAAKDLIRSGAIQVNGVIIDSPSYHLHWRDAVICTRDGLQPIGETRPVWLVHDGTVGRLRHMPKPHELHRPDIDMRRVIEYYAVL